VATERNCATQQRKPERLSCRTHPRTDRESAPQFCSPDLPPGCWCFEDLNITNMQKNRHLAKSIADVAWNQFITITESRAEEAGSRVILVNHGESRLSNVPGVVRLSPGLSLIAPITALIVGSRWIATRTRAFNIMRSGLQPQRCRGIPGCPRREKGEQSQ